MNLTNPSVLRALLEPHGFRFSKSMGQNFLIAQWVPERIAEEAELDETVGVLEVGPGVGCLTEAEKACIADITSFLETVDTIPCTGCRYCTEGCPQKIMIPMAFSNYNTAVKFGNKTAQLRDYNRSCANLADCVECGQCMDACPQHLEIPQLLKKVRAYFEG